MPQRKSFIADADGWMDGGWEMMMVDASTFSESAYKQLTTVKR